MPENESRKPIIIQTTGEREVVKYTGVRVPASVFLPLPERPLQMSENEPCKPIVIHTALERAIIDGQSLRWAATPMPLTVGELVKQLQELDPSMPVVIPGTVSTDGNPIDVRTVRVERYRRPPGGKPFPYVRLQNARDIHEPDVSVVELG